MSVCALGNLKHNPDILYILLYIRKANHFLTIAFIPASSHTVCADNVQRTETLCVVPDFIKRTASTRFPVIPVCVRMCVRGVTSVAVCVAMVMLAAGQDRTCQGRWRGQTDRQTGAQTHTCGNDSGHVSHCVCGSDDMARLN